MGNTLQNELIKVGIDIRFSGMMYPVVMACHAAAVDAGWSDDEWNEFISYDETSSTDELIEYMSKRFDIHYV